MLAEQIDRSGDVKARSHPYMQLMENFNYREPPDVFVGGGRLSRRYPMAYRRFQTGAEAVRFVMELQSSDKLVGTVVECDDARFGAAEIRLLYESVDYPLPRRQAS